MYKYNFIYEKLVESEDDLVGLIAYGIYKKHKIEYITRIKEEQKREPTDEECHSFFVASTTSSQLDKYRSQAEDMLLEMAGNITESELKQYESDMLKNYKKEISSCMPSNWRTFFISIGAGIVSALLFAIIAGLFYFIGETSDRSTHDKVKDFIEKIENQGLPSDSMVIHYNNKESADS